MAGRKPIPVEYVSKSSNLIITLESITEVIINGRMIKQPGLRAEFRDGRFVTTNKEIIERLDDLLIHHRGMARKFQRCPSPNQMAKIQDTIKRIKDAQDKVVEESESSKKEVSEFEKFSDFLKSRKGVSKAEEMRVEREMDKPAMVQGIRDVGM